MEQVQACIACAADTMETVDAQSARFAIVTGQEVALAMGLNKAQHVDNASVTLGCTTHKLQKESLVKRCGEPHYRVFELTQAAMAVARPLASTRLAVGVSRPSTAADTTVDHGPSSCAASWQQAYLSPTNSIRLLRCTRQILYGPRVDMCGSTGGCKCLLLNDNPCDDCNGTSWKIDGKLTAGRH